jgi:hypothetical protein
MAQLTCFEDENLILEVMSHLEWTDVVKKMSLVSRLFRHASCDSRLWRFLFLSFWQTRQLSPSSSAVKVPDCKEAFKKAFLDAKRTRIAQEELVSFSWFVTFSSRWDPAGSVSRRQVYFLPNGTFHNNKGQWSTTLPWRLMEDGTVRVGDYQPLTISRSADWGWVMSNDGAHYETIGANAGERPALPKPRFAAGFTGDELDRLEDLMESYDWNSMVDLNEDGTD